MSRADLHFHLDGRNLEQIEMVAYKIADNFYGYKGELDNPEFLEWQKERDAWEDQPSTEEEDEEFGLEEPPRKIDNPTPRPYRITVEANVDGTPDEYNYALKFRASVKCYTPYEHDNG